MKETKRDEMSHIRFTGSVILAESPNSSGSFLILYQYQIFHMKTVCIWGVGRSRERQALDELA